MKIIKHSFLLGLLLTLPAPALWAQGNADATNAATPCLDVLHLFTAPDVPAMGPGEAEAPIGNWTNGITPPNLPGNGLGQHSMLYVGENYNKMFLVHDGKPIWTYSTGTGYEYDDVWMLSNGNILYSRMQYVEEITPDKKVVWRYDCNNEPGAKHTEIHTCQPIGLDRVMFVENGLPPRLKIINIKTGVVEVDHEVPFSGDPNGIHGQYRRARVTAQGTYLLAVFGMGYVVELDKDFKEIWRYDIKSPWAAIRLKNGNTLITDESEHLAREVNSKGETVWEFNTDDLPRRVQARVAVTDLHAARQRQHDFHFARQQRQRPATRRNHAGQESRLGAARLENARRRHRRADFGRPRHSRNSRSIGTLRTYPNRMNCRCRDTDLSCLKCWIGRNHRRCIDI